jgi:hypothetical protein
MPITILRHVGRNVFTLNIKTVRGERITFHCGCVVWQRENGLAHENHCLNHVITLRNGTVAARYAIVQSGRYAAKSNGMWGWSREAPTMGSQQTARRIARRLQRAGCRCKVVEVR